MKIENKSNIANFKSKCREITLGSDVCRMVNRELPHISLTKHSPYFDRAYEKKVISPMFVMKKIIDFNGNRPPNCGNAFNYLVELINFAKEYKSYNCYESSWLCALGLHSNCIDNVKICSVNKGSTDVDHVVCVFNRNGSPFCGEIKNNQTIIVDAWAGLCDFANNLLPCYDNILPDCIKKNIEGNYSLTPINKVKLSEEELYLLTSEHLSLVV